MQFKSNHSSEKSVVSKASIIKNILLFLMVFIVFISLCIHTIMQINVTPLIGDGLGNFELSYHLAQHNVMSDGSRDDSNVLIPSNVREPLPVALSALWIKSIPALSKVNSMQDLQHGKKFIYLKFQNVIYVALLIIGIFLLALTLYQPYLTTTFNVIASTVTVLLCYASMHILYVNNLTTEFHAALIIVWFILSWLNAWRTEKIIYYGLAGLLFGGLILTKAAFMYIGTASVLFVMAYLFVAKHSRTIIFHHMLILVLAALTVLPWFARNYVQIGAWELTQRGPIVLLTRAYKNAMTSDEFKGAFYAYAPASLKKTMKNITGYHQNDRLNGGRLQRLTRFPVGDLELRAQGNEADAISYYIKASTHANNIHEKYHQLMANPLQARVSADQQVKKEAVNLILRDIPAHLKATLVFAWRGAWPCNTVDGRWRSALKKQPVWQELLPFFGLITMCLLLISSIFKKNISDILLTILGVSAFSFYALITHFIPRYSEMFIAIWVICFCYCLVKWMVFFFQNWVCRNKAH